MSEGDLLGTGDSSSRCSSASLIAGIAKLNDFGACVGAEGILFIGLAFGDKKSVTLSLSLSPKSFNEIVINSGEDGLSEPLSSLPKVCSFSS